MGPMEGTRKVVFFPHSKAEFRTKHNLRDWLAGTLREDYAGTYLVREGRGLGDLSEGSLVFFVREDVIVGCAIVEEALREISAEERTANNYSDVYKKIIKFVPNSIWAWSDSQFINLARAREIVGKAIGAQGFTKVDDLPTLLALFAEIKAPVPSRKVS